MSLSKELHFLSLHKCLLAVKLLRITEFIFKRRSELEKKVHYLMLNAVDQIIPGVDLSCHLVIWIRILVLWSKRWL